MEEIRRQYRTVNVTLWTGLIITILLTTALQTTGTQGFQEKICQASKCPNNNCSKVSCYNGDCSDNGLCLCSPCWNGKSCNQYQNVYYPTFDQRKYVANVTTPHSANDIIITVHASDPDTQLVCHLGTELSGSCDCGKVVYAIESGNERGLFSMDPDTGDIHLINDHNPSGSTYRGPAEVLLYVTATNREIEGEGGDVVGPKNYATVKVLMDRRGRVEDLALDGYSYPEDRPLGEVNEEENYLDEVHSRKRRSITQVSNITFYLIKTGVYDMTTVMYVGSKIHFQLQIQFPVGVSDLLVELFTPDNATTVMVICAPQITHVGSNIKYDPVAATPVTESKDGSTNYDRAILNFGNVTNIDTTNTYDNESMIFIEWDAVMIENGQTVNGSVYWVSAGAEYNDANDIWIGQAGFTTIIDDYNTSTSTPTFNISGPSTVQIGTTSVYTIDMYMPYPVTDLVFEAFSPLNYTDAMSACSALVTGVGENYECLDYSKLTYTLYPSATGQTNERVRMDIGRVLNKGSREVTPWVDNRISIKFTMRMPYNESMIGLSMFVGATMEIGTNQIWAGQISVNIANITAIDFLDPVAFTRTVVRHAAVKSFALVEYNITTANDTDAVYKLSVNVPTGRFKICNVAINYQGVNVPCFVDAKPVYSSSVPGPVDTAVWDLGRVRNIAARQLSMDPQANNIQIYITVEVLDVAANTVGSTGAVNIVLDYGTRQDSSPSPTITVQAAQAGSTPTNATAPIGSLSMMNGSGIAYVNSSSDIRLRVSTYRGAVYDPFTVVFAMPNTGIAPLYSICRAEVLSVGKNMPCVNQSLTNQSVVYSALTPDTRNYLATYNMGSVCNMGPTVNGSYNQSDYDDVIEYSVIVRIEDHPLLANGSTNDITAIISFSSTLTWEYTYSLTVWRPYMVTYYGQKPFIEVPRLGVANMTSNTSVSQAPPSGLVSFEILIKIPPQTVADWSFTADVMGDPDLSVCSISVVQTGYAVPCVDKTQKMRDVSRPDGSGIGTGILEVYKLSNVGNNQLYMDDIFDNNSVVLNVVVQVSKAAAQGSMHSVWLGVDYGMDGVDASNNMSVVVSGSVNMGVPSILPNYTLYNTPVNDNATVVNTLYPGETVILTGQLDMPEDANMDVRVRFDVTPKGVLDINQAHVVWVGANLPCLRMKMIHPNISSSSAIGTGDTVIVDIGRVCQISINNDPFSDQLRIELIATLLINSGLASGSQITVSSIMTINNVDQPPTNLVFTFDPQVPLTEMPNYLTMPMADIKVNVTPGAVFDIAPYDLLTVFIDVTVPANASVFGVVDSVVPISTSAIATIMDISVVSFGRNLGSLLQPTAFKTVYNTTQGTSQNDNVFIDLSKLTNTGHTYRADIYEEGDDVIRLRVILQMADAFPSDAGAQFTISFGAKLGTPILFDNVTVAALRTPQDEPSLNLEVDIDQSTVYTTGDTIAVNGQLKHNNLSRAEGINVDIKIFLPKYLSAVADLSTSFIGSPAPTLANITAANGFVISMPHLYFTDVVNFTLTLFISGTKNGPYNGEQSTITLQPVFDITGRTGLIINPIDIAPDLTAINITVVPPATAVCANGPLGMSSTILKDCQISGSPTAPLNGPLMARPTVSTGWKPAQRYGPFSAYLQVNFQYLTTVNSVTFTNPGTSTNQVSSFRLQFSNDAINWTPGSVISSVAYGTPVSVTAVMDAVYIRLEILSCTDSTTQPEVHVEFDGCTTDALPNTCGVRNGWQQIANPQSDYYPRGFLSDGTNVYFCDTLPSEDYSQCYTSANGILFKALDETIVNVLGYLSPTGPLYGLDWNMKAVVSSSDNGLTWSSVSLDRYIKDKSSGASFVSYTQVTWSTLVNPEVSSSAVNWGAGYYGVYDKSSLQRADWMQCCA